MQQPIPVPSSPELERSPGRQDQLLPQEADSPPEHGSAELPEYTDEEKKRMFALRLREDNKLRDNGADIDAEGRLYVYAYVDDHKILYNALHRMMENELAGRDNVSTDQGAQIIQLPDRQQPD